MARKRKNEEQERDEFLNSDLDERSAFIEYVHSKYGGDDEEDDCYDDDDTYNDMSWGRSPFETDEDYNDRMEDLNDYLEGLWND